MLTDGSCYTKFSFLMKKLHILLGQKKNENFMFLLGSRLNFVIHRVFLRLWKYHSFLSTFESVSVLWKKSHLCVLRAWVFFRKLTIWVFFERKNSTSSRKDRSKTLERVQELKVNTKIKESHWRWLLIIIQIPLGKLKEEVFICLCQLVFVILWNNTNIFILWAWPVD